MTAWRYGVLTVLLLVATGCGVLRNDVNSSVTSSGGGGVVEVFAPDQRDLVKPVSGTLLTGDSFDSRDLEGRVVVYNLWGSWCGPCRKEAPALRQAALEYESRGVTFVGLDVKDRDDAARAFERRYRIPYPSLQSSDASGALLAFGARLGASAVPTTLVVDDSGRLAARVLGVVTYSTLAGLLDDLAEEPPGASPR